MASGIRLPGLARLGGLTVRAGVAGFLGGVAAGEALFFRQSAVAALSGLAWLAGLRLTRLNGGRLAGLTRLVGLLRRAGRLALLGTLLLALRFASGNRLGRHVPRRGGGQVGLAHDALGFGQRLHHRGLGLNRLGGSFLRLVLELCAQALHDLLVRAGI